MPSWDLNLVSEKMKKEKKAQNLTSTLDQNGRPDRSKTELIFPPLTI